MEVQKSIRLHNWCWEALFQTASDEGLLPLVFSQFRSLDLLKDIPEEIADFLLAVETANRERNQSIIDELKAAVAILTPSTVTALYFGSSPRITICVPSPPFLRSETPGNLPTDSAAFASGSSWIRAAETTFVICSEVSCWLIARSLPDACAVTITPLLSKVTGSRAKLVVVVWPSLT